MTDEEPVPSTSSGGGGGGGSRTRSGKAFGLSDVVQVDEEEEEDLVTAMMRQGGEFQRVTRGHYPTLAMLRQVHHQLFSPRSSFVMIGEFSYFLRLDVRIMKKPWRRRPVRFLLM
jgi:hypothetical protein